MSVGNITYKLAQIILGAFIAAFAINNFIVPHHLLTGGISGIALIVNYLYGTPAGIINFILNIPLFIMGCYFLHRGFIWRSLLGMSCFSFFLYLTRGMVILRVDDILLTALLGGAFTGIGYGLLFRGRGSCGGTDIIAIVIHRFFSFHIGSINFLFNTGILTIAAFAFRDIRMAGYTLLSLFVTSTMVDKIQVGFNTNKSAIIISDKSEEIARAIMSGVHRGVTFLHGTGAYTHREKNVIMCTFSITQMAKLKDLVESIDPKAFMIVNDAVEVVGKGFEKGLRFED